MTAPRDAWLPTHHDVPTVQRAWEVACILAAALLMISGCSRLLWGPLDGWVAVWAGAGILWADLSSGIVHWAADTWGRASLPVIGRRFLHPFRVHHVNPDDFLRRDVIDTNGDVSMLLVPVLVAAHRIPLDTPAGVALFVFAMSFAVAAWPTNQVHQWAHHPDPPPVVRWLQDRGVILGRDAHRRHHAPPHTTHYAIALGWLNRPLAAIGFFPALERLVTAMTGLQPRSDEAVFQAQVAAAGTR